MPGTVPDGIAFDENGDLYIACYRPDAVFRWRNSGDYEVVASDDRGTDYAAPTNLAFGGQDRRDVFVASLGRWHVSKFRADSPGMALSYPSPIELGAPIA